MKYRRINTAFNGGELSPFAQGRVGLEQYAQGCVKMRNVTALPQGGFIRRNGFDMVDNLGTDSNIKRIPFSRGSQGYYMFIVTAGRLRIYRDAQKVYDVTGQIPYLPSEINALDFAQFADSVIITGADRPPLQILYDGSDTQWKIQDAALTSIPLYNFNDDDSPAGQDEIQEIEMDDWLAGTDPKGFFLELGGFETEEIIWDENGVTTARRIQDALLALTITPPTGIDVINVDQADGGGTVLKRKFVVTFTGDAQDNWPQMKGRDANASASGELDINISTTQDGQSREELVWSDLRGWPSVVTFFENRMWLANTKLRKQTFWASRINEYFDFNQGLGDPADSFDDTLSTSVNTTIVALQAGREIQILTESSEHYCPIRPITPANHPFPPQTSNGSRREVPATDVDGATYFAQARGTGIRQFVYTESEGAYTSDNPSIISEHLITDVIDMESRQGVEEVDANYLYVVNRSGLVAVYNLLRSQGVATWTAWETNAGEFYRMGEVEGDLWAVIKIGASYYLTLGNEQSPFDLEQRFSNASVVTLSNASAYPQTVSVVADGLYLGEYQRNGSTVTLNREYKQIAVGVNFVPVVTPTDIADQVGSGVVLNKRKRISRVFVRMVDSIGWVIEYAGRDYSLNYRHLPLSLANPAAAPFTGDKEKRLMGYIEAGNITLKQPYPFARSAITALTLEVKTV